MIAPLNAPAPALEQLWSEFAIPLRAFLRGRVRSPADAEDLLQDVFLKVHQRIGDLRDAAKLEGWLYQIARNAVIDHYRRQRPAEPLTDDFAAGSGAVDIDDVLCPATQHASESTWGRHPTMRNERWWNLQSAVMA